MPELPDIELYLHALQPRVSGQPLERLRVLSPFLVRTVEPPLEAAAGCVVTGLRRLGKRIVFELRDADQNRDREGAASAAGPVRASEAPGTAAPLFLVLHLMIAGRLRWLDHGKRPPGKIALATFDFPTGTLVLTEAATQKRAALHLVRGETALRQHDPGGLDPLTTHLAAFAAALRSENHTLKRALTDPRLIAGIGNAYSDEILHAARLSPLALTAKLTDDDIARLHERMRSSVQSWTAKLRADFGGRFPGPGDVTAFRPEFAVHGKFGQPCPVCGTAVQRIRYAENETNYCPACQTGGRILADRSLSRLLREDWPRTIEEL